MHDFKAKVNCSTVLGRIVYSDVQKDSFLALDNKLLVHQFSMEKKEDTSPHIAPSPILLH